LKGIDISAWQTDVDWQAIVDAGIEFVILKLGQSGRLDEMFIDHVNNVVAHGLKYGVYFYSKATSAEDAQAESDWVDAQIKQYLNGVCPEMGIWYDMEHNSIADSGTDITALCRTFIDQLKTAGYGYVGVYSSYNWLTNGNIDTANLDVPYWCAQYNFECNFPNPKIWQNTDALAISGQLFDGDISYD
jgi:GH25 family lysozyme M1 (1,4-beta-N-acetylmuramidase)